MTYLDELAARRRFGMKPGLEAIRNVCAALGDPQRAVRAIHIAGTNGKGATAAMLDACLRAAGLRVARYTSPHLVRLNERFHLDGRCLPDDTLAAAARRVAAVAPQDLTFFEALTAVAFLVFGEEKCDYAVLETGLGGRLDATNICESRLSVITRIGLDHCDWLGSTLEQIAAEKGGIIKPRVSVVVGRNEPQVVRVLADIARRADAPFFYAPDLVRDDEIPGTFALHGAFNRENALTALAALKVLAPRLPRAAIEEGFAHVVWPGRFQRVGAYLIDGAHNPPAARALVAAWKQAWGLPEGEPSLSLVAGFCGDKDVDATLEILSPLCARGFAVRTNNPRSLAPERLADKMTAAGIPSVPCATLKTALDAALQASAPAGAQPAVLVCGSLFLAGEALVALGAYPNEARFDPSERLVP